MPNLFRLRCTLHAKRSFDFSHKNWYIDVLVTLTRVHVAPSHPTSEGVAYETNQSTQSAEHFPVPLTWLTFVGNSWVWRYPRAASAQIGPQYLSFRPRQTACRRTARSLDPRCSLRPEALHRPFLPHSCRVLQWIQSANPHDGVGALASDYRTCLPRCTFFGVDCLQPFHQRQSDGIRFRASFPNYNNDL